MTAVIEIVSGLKNKRMKARSHPENFCHECGSPNCTWYAPNELWNKLCETWEIICPKCFQKRADEAGINIVFTVELTDKE